MPEGIVVLAAADPGVTALFDAVTAAASDNALPIVGGLGAIAAVAFGIKMMWVAWRAGSKAVGKTGT